MDGRDDIGTGYRDGRSARPSRRRSRSVSRSSSGSCSSLLFGGIVVQCCGTGCCPDIFGLRRVTFWEALGLLALCRILFGGFGKGGSHAHSSDRRLAAKACGGKRPSRRASRQPHHQRPHPSSSEADHDGLTCQIAKPVFDFGRAFSLAALCCPSDSAAGRLAGRHGLRRERLGPVRPADRSCGGRSSAARRTPTGGAASR